MSKNDIDIEMIRKIAKSVRGQLSSRYGIEKFDNPFEIISKLEKYIIIRFSNDNKIQGFTTEKNGFKCIYINSNDVLGRQHYSCWHEFFHSIDDRKKINEGSFEVSITGSNEICEREAEYFASCMLLDKEVLEDYIIQKWGSESNLSELDLIDIQYEFGVSYQALKNKLHEIYNNGRFYTYTINSIENREKYLEAIKNKGYSTKLVEKTNDFCIPISFKNDLLDCYKNKQITFEKLEKTVKFLDEKEVEFKW
ncbi:ImmA/IrrE family metallo-endopeptidase [Clostridium perfringens]|uniref:ImmA/IrrE family metallo-endopeptidase n=1 Tax=Clostridium perfringens TaxID=1502 RepID=UPI0024BCB960|nr:ImmA/IrrE family metallo-endopeptidase [Clostridium perfringens]MDM0618075.1 ImmA/IrrE family metallo-endopeptidase [Clostridium perfringens]